MGAMSTPDGQMPGPGSLLDGRYRLDAVIARGGMSMVHLATDERLDRHVAVKLLDPVLAGDRAFVDRFTLEARSAARLSDPGIVQVFDQGVEGETPFLVMELVPGGTLRELLDERGPMPPYAAAAVLRPLLGALREAHDAGLVHRDIKPENVLISTNGAVKLADFGLVRAVAESRATSNSVVMGTAAYLSPEQISGSDTDGRSDLYSLGVLAYEMLTGVPPFSGDSSVAVAYRRLDTDVAAPSDQSDSVSEALDRVVLRATRRSREDRYTDAGQMLDELDEAARIGRFPRTPSPRPASPPGPGRAPPRRSRVPVANRSSTPPTGRVARPCGGATGRCPPGCTPAPTSPPPRPHRSPTGGPQRARTHPARSSTRAGAPPSGRVAGSDCCGSASSSRPRRCSPWRGGGWVPAASRPFRPCRACRSGRPPRRWAGSGSPRSPGTRSATTSPRPRWWAPTPT